MYSLYPQKGHGFAVVHYARFSTYRGLITAPRPLGQTFVTTPKPSEEPPKMYLPVREESDRQLELVAALARSEGVSSLHQLIDRGRDVLRTMLSQAVVIGNETRLTKRMRLAPRQHNTEAHLMRSAGGLILAQAGQTAEDLLTEPSMELEFDGWVATPEEIDAMESIGRVAEDFRPPHDTTEPVRIGNYI